MQDFQEKSAAWFYRYLSTFEASSTLVLKSYLIQIEKRTKLPFDQIVHWLLAWRCLSWVCDAIENFLNLESENFKDESDLVNHYLPEQFDSSTSLANQPQIWILFHFPFHIVSRSPTDFETIFFEVMPLSILVSKILI